MPITQLYERCSLAHQWGVIPVPRHWDPGNLTLNK
ncbi:hypothetical protein HC356_04410 [Wolbachia pipientis]|uniref:Uncharacterized protein n=1 Tax=Wolbachia pipientis TaxID=955 RepID=A0A7G5CDF6_WOLPI|nr:hypothetical protein HC356_04410 [Wolbachia pipientis]